MDKTHAEARTAKQLAERFSGAKHLSAITVIVLVFVLTALPSSTNAQQSAARSAVAKRKLSLQYYPPKGDAWQRKSPAQVGMNKAKLDAAIEFAKTRESRVPRDFSTQEQTFGRLLGRMPKERGATNGIILRHGYIVAEWGDTLRACPTYSVAKSFLSTLLGLAIDRKLIKSINDPVRHLVKDGGYDSPRNSKITWDHHARQASEWHGAMWGKSDNFMGVEEFGQGRREPRELREPGEFYEYNDVRINRLALSLLRVWNKPLPQVLRDEVMNPIGASDTWRYYGYRNSNVMIRGKPVPSISGGTRWGGGLWISTRDEARFGYLFLREGQWRGKQIISREWIRQATTPGATKADYGYLWWLNTNQTQWANAPERSFAALGYGSNAIWIDPEHDLVVVWRWHDGNLNELIKRVLAAVER
ncbi:MAG: beta-lactamase family protein [Pyrinomonadaceae bacterium MAG19_C2-C3]|nr:beta-lactamase family protein [Pyrinomonadaceae bacterium MAG19_C2-C3]